MSSSVKLFFACFIVFLFTEVQNESGVDDLGRKGLDRLQQEWKECCRKKPNLCIRGSCYSLEWRAATWSAVRDRCRGRHSEWPFSVDVIRLTKEEDISVLWKLLSRAKNYEPDQSAQLPATVWTSGLRCPERGPEGVIFSNRWTSSETFPGWLEEKVKTLDYDENNKEDCTFLVVSPNADGSKVTYQFQAQDHKHAAVCQFLFPSQEITQTSEFPIITNVSHSQTSRVLSTRGTTKEERPTEVSTVRDGSKKTTTSPLGTSPKNTPASSATSEKRQSTTGVPNVSDSVFIGCKRREFEGILWPDTPAGMTAQKPCPKGLRGTAEWTCDKETMTFVPEKPRYDNCRHEWLVEMEKELLNGKEDPITISRKVANKTVTSELSHGDLSALVKLVGKVLSVYEKQKEQEAVEQRQPPSYHLAQSFATTYSHVLRDDVSRAWADLDKANRIREASMIVKQMSAVGHHLSCSQISTDDLQFTVVEQNINLQTFVLNPSGRKEEPYVFPKRTGCTKVSINDSSTIFLPGNLTLKELPQSKCGIKTRTGFGILYKNMGKFLKTSNSSGTVVATPIINFSLGNGTVSVNLPSRAPVKIVLEHTKSWQILTSPRCVFWNFSRGVYGEWDDSGCKTIYTNESHTCCLCDHITNFAVLMDITNSIPTEDKLLEMMTYVCCGLSAVALLGTCMCLLFVKSLHCRRSTITCNLSICLFFVDVIIVFGLQQTTQKVICTIVAGTLHFTLLSAFCWMLLEGYHLYQMVILVFSRSSFSTAYFYLFGYGVPAIIVAISASLRWSDYGGQNWCWLSNNNGLMWSFVGPACIIILVNFVIFIRTMRSASSLKIKKEQSTVRNIKSMVKGSFSIMCLLGLTWCAGLLYAVKVLYFTSYIFTILNGLQGVFIFIFHILLNSKATSAFTDAFRKGMEWNSSRTNTLRVMTSNSGQHRVKKTSTNSLTSPHVDEGNKTTTKQRRNGSRICYGEKASSPKNRRGASFLYRKSSGEGITFPCEIGQQKAGALRCISVRAENSSDRYANGFRSFTANIESREVSTKKYYKSKETVSVSFVM